MSNMAVHYSSSTPEWYTPAEVIHRVVTTLGVIDLDPCSNSAEHPNVPALQHYTIHNNGLEQPWHGKVYMNPPYGRVIKYWIEKLAVEYEAGRTTEAIALVPARTDTVWFRRLRANSFCFINGRLKFSAAPTPAPFPSVALYLGDRPDAFYEAFAGFGILLEQTHTSGTS